MAKLDATELVILSAIFARSNMGQGLPAKRAVERWKTNYDHSARSAPPALASVVDDFCGKFMESDDHQTIFMEEARSWYTELKRYTAERVAQTWDDIAELYWRDAATYADNDKWPNG